MSEEIIDQERQALMQGEGEEYRSLADSLARAHAFEPRSEKTDGYQAEYAAGSEQHFGRTA